jgi:hypothetical protein
LRGRDAILICFRPAEWHSGGQGFDSPRLHQVNQHISSPLRRQHEYCGPAGSNFGARTRHLSCFSRNRSASRYLRWQSKGGIIPTICSYFARYTLPKNPLRPFEPRTTRLRPRKTRLKHSTLLLIQSYADHFNNKANAPAAAYQLHSPGMRWCGLILNADGSDFQASQMLWNGVFHFSVFSCLAKM